MDFQEEHVVGLVRRYAQMCRGRGANAENMKAFYRAMVPVAKKGRPTAEQEELATRYQSCIRKLCDHEERVASLLASRKRRLTHKGSIHEDDQNVAAAEQSEAVSSIMQKPIQYRYADKPAYSVKGRRCTSNGGAQSMSRRLQCHAVDGHTTDLDIQNCCLTIIQQIIRKTMPDPALPQDLGEALDEVTKRRAEFLQKLGEQPVEGKEIRNTVLNSGTPPSHLREHISSRSYSRFPYTLDGWPAIFYIQIINS